MAKPGALAKLDVESALAEMASGVLSRQIAARYGVTSYAVRKKLSNHPKYKDIVAEQAHSFVESAMAELMDAPLDAVAIARARAKVDGAIRYAKAHNPAYADHPDTSGVQVQVVIAPNGVTPGQTYEQIAVRLPDKR